MPTPDDHQTARDALLTLFFATDRREWVTVRALLADTVDLDYTSLNGGQPSAIDADALVTAWKGLLPGFDATHHQITVVTSRDSTDGAIDIIANGTATHRLASASGDSFWTIAGYYDATLRPSGARWVIVSLKFTATWGQGNQQLVAIAQQRAAAED